MAGLSHANWQDSGWYKVHGGAASIGLKPRTDHIEAFIRRVLDLATALHVCFGPTNL